MLKTVDFIGLGFCSNDYLCVLPRIPLNSKVEMHHYETQGGGPAATATVAAARLGLSCALVSVVGDDEAGEKILADLNGENVTTSAMKIRQNSNSPIAYCWVDQPSGQRSIAWSRGNCSELEANEIDEPLIKSAKMLHLDGHNPKAALAACKIAKANNVIINLDAGTMRDGMSELIAYADILIASEEFARLLTGEEDLKKALKQMKNIGAKVTGVTMGIEGSMVYDNGEFIKCPTFVDAPVVDTTGAGDVFHSAFGVRYLETKDLYECQRFGSAVSTLKCAKLGGRAGIPTREMVDKFLKEN